MLHSATIGAIESELGRAGALPRGFNGSIDNRLVQLAELAREEREAPYRKFLHIDDFLGDSKSNPDYLRPVRKNEVGSVVNSWINQLTEGSYDKFFAKSFWDEKLFEKYSEEVQDVVGLMIELNRIKKDKGGEESAKIDYPCIFNFAVADLFNNFRNLDKHEKIDVLNDYRESLGRQRAWLSGEIGRLEKEGILKKGHPNGKSGEKPEILQHAPDTSGKIIDLDAVRRQKRAEMEQKRQSISRPADPERMKNDFSSFMMRCQQSLEYGIDARSRLDSVRRFFEYNHMKNELLKYELSKDLYSSKFSELEGRLEARGREISSALERHNMDLPEWIAVSKRVLDRRLKKNELREMARNIIMKRVRGGEQISAAYSGLDEIIYSLKEHFEIEDPFEEAKRRKMEEKMKAAGTAAALPLLNRRSFDMNETEFEKAKKAIEEQEKARKYGIICKFDRDWANMRARIDSYFNDLKKLNDGRYLAKVRVDVIKRLNEHPKFAGMDPERKNYIYGKAIARFSENGSAASREMMYKRHFGSLGLASEVRDAIIKSAPGENMRTVRERLYFSLFPKKDIDKKLSGFIALVISSLKMTCIKYAGEGEIDMNSVKLVDRSRLEKLYKSMGYLEMLFATKALHPHGLNLQDKMYWHYLRANRIAIVGKLNDVDVTQNYQNEMKQYAVCLNSLRAAGIARAA